MWVVTIIGEVYIPHRGLVEALYTLNSPSVVSFNLREAAVPEPLIRPDSKPSVKLFEPFRMSSLQPL